MDVFCENCGNKIEYGSQFCSECGNEIRSILGTEKKSSIAQISKPENSAFFVLETKKAWIILGCIALVVSLYFVTKTIYAGYKNQQQRTQILLQQQKEALEAANKQIEDVQAKAETENKKLQNQVTTLQNQKSTKIKSDADIITEWANRVAEVTCFWPSETGGGSATLVNLADHGVTAVTNKHVIFDSTLTYAPDSCVVGIYGNGARVVNYISPGNPVWFGSGDWGYIFLDNSEAPSDNGFFDKVTSNQLNVCKESQVNLGDQIVILGYPAIGTQNGITATEGIISGIENDYYVTSAKIDHGNSGGAAVSVKNDCWIGIPTWAASGSIESLGRILKAQFVLGS